MERWQLPPVKGFVVTTLLIAKDVARSRKFYEHVFEAEIIEEEDPVAERPMANPPSATGAPPSDPDRLSIALNLRVADIHACYKLWRSRGAEFLTEPKLHEDEIRCYIRDPDGYLIEVGQST